MFDPRKIMQALIKSANPSQMLLQMAQQHPAIRQAMNAVNGKTPDQIREMAYSIANQRGINLNTFLRELGVKAPDK